MNQSGHQLNELMARALKPFPFSITQAMAAYASSSVAEIPPDYFPRIKLYPAPAPTVKFILLR